MNKNKENLLLKIKVWLHAHFPYSMIGDGMTVDSYDRLLEIYSQSLLDTIKYNLNKEIK